MSGGDDDLVVWAGVEEPHHRVETDEVGPGERGGEAEPLQDPGEEEEELVVRQLLARAVPLAHQKGNAPLRPHESPASRVQEPVRIEPFRLLPICRIIHDKRDVCVDRGAGGQVVAVELEVLCGGVGRGVCDAGVAQHLVNHGLGVGHGRSVLQRGLSLPPHHGQNLRCKPLLHGRVADQVLECEAEDGGGGL